MCGGVSLVPMGSFGLIRESNEIRGVGEGGNGSDGCEEGDGISMKTDCKGGGEIRLEDVREQEGR